jgi:hypothetical protein
VFVPRRAWGIGFRGKASSDGPVQAAGTIMVSVGTRPQGWCGLVVLEVGRRLYVAWSALAEQAAGCVGYGWQL